MSAYVRMSLCMCPRGIVMANMCYTTVSLLWAEGRHVASSYNVSVRKLTIRASYVLGFQSQKSEDIFARTPRASVVVV